MHVDIRDVSLISGLGRSPGGGNGNPLQYSCLENPMDRGSWWATAHGVAKSQHNWSDLACMQDKIRKPEREWFPQKLSLILWKVSFYQGISLKITAIELGMGEMALKYWGELSKPKKYVHLQDLKFSFILKKSKLEIIGDVFGAGFI